MKKVSSIMTALLLLGSAMAYADGFSRSGNSVTIQVAKPQRDGAKMVRLEVVNENINRVRATPEETFPEKTSLIIVPQKAKPQFEVSEKQFASLHPLQMRLVHYGRQFGGDECRTIPLGEAYYCDIIRYVQFFAFYGIESSIGSYIVECDNGIRRVRIFEQFQGSISRHVEINSSTSHEFSFYGYLVFSQCLQIAMFPPPYHVKMVGATHERYSSASIVNEMLRCLLSSHISICHHLREEVGQTCPGEEDEGYAHVMYFTEMRVIYRVLSKTRYDSLHMHGYEIVDGLFLPHMVFMTIGAKD